MEDKEKNMEFSEHLNELRTKLIYITGPLLTASIIFFYFGEKLISIAKYPLKNNLNFVALSPTEAFISVFKLSITAALIATLPLILYQVYDFLAPAFNRSNRKRLLFWIFITMFFFYTGLLFSYFLAIPAALNFLLSYTEAFAKNSISIGRFFSFYTAFCLLGAVSFQLPVIMGWLSDLSLIKTETFTKKRKHALIIIVIVTAIITPTQDIFNLILFSFPLYMLYELGIIFSKILNKKN